MAKIEPAFRPPEAITAAHDTGPFASTRDTLNVWLKRHALKNEGRTSRTYVVAQGTRVVGFYALAAGGVTRDTPPRSVRHDSPSTVPLVVLGRLATDQTFEGRGIGSGMLRDAIARTLRSAGEIGVRGLVVHALDDDATKFYLRYGFVPCPVGERTLFLAVETALRALSAK